MGQLPWPKDAIILRMKSGIQIVYKLLILLSFLLSICAYSQVNLRNILKDPAISLRCKELISEREEKIKVKQKTQFLLRRAQGIEENSPPAKVTIKRKMKISGAKLKRKLFIVEKQIDKMEDNIIRKGCPGITI